MKQLNSRYDPQAATSCFFKTGFKGLKKTISITFGVMILSILTISLVNAEPPRSTAFEFDGETSHVEIEHSEELELREGGTVEAWIYISGHGHGEWPRLMSAATWELMLDGVDQLRLGMAGTAQTLVEPRLKLNRWYHVAVSFDGEQWVFYVDGERVGNYSESALPSAGEGVLVIADASGGDRKFEGKMQEVRIWDHVRGRDEIEDYMNAALQGDEEGLIGCWPLDGDAADVTEKHRGRIIGDPAVVLVRPFKVDLEEKNVDVEKVNELILGPVELREPEGEVSYQWYRDGIRLEGAADNVLAFTDLDQNYTGYYYVEADDERELTPVQSSRVKLAVAERPIAGEPEKVWWVKDSVEISSLEELFEYAGESGNHIKMKPGTYKMTDYIPIEEVRDRIEREFINFSGNDNVFDLTDVTLEFDTELRAELDPPRHSPEFVVSGENNLLKGLAIENTGDGTSRQGNVLTVSGDGNTVKNVTLHVQGSFPYGYGSLLGKGGGRGWATGDRLRKHSGLRITGSNTRILGCNIFMRSFGHGIYIQRGAVDTVIKDTHIEGEMRSTDEMLEDETGPVVEAGYINTWTGEKIEPGQMISLAEDGIRAYNQNVRNVRVVNCTLHKMRGSISLLQAEGRITVENTTVKDNQWGFRVPDNAEIFNGKANARYGPVLHMRNNRNIYADITVLPSESDFPPSALATVRRDDHKIRLSLSEGRNLTKELPIIVDEGNNVELINETMMPIKLKGNTRNSRLKTNGEVIQEESGQDNEILPYK